MRKSTVHSLPSTVGEEKREPAQERKRKDFNTENAEKTEETQASEESVRDEAREVAGFVEGAG
jgi:hypothetical protein